MRQRKRAADHRIAFKLEAMGRLYSHGLDRFEAVR